ncbi:rRNA maturation RNase YbeY [Alkalibacter saccharofermentans]|uniref:Endoribonuclease YbeY n=1 Tax=Alkalibacter saccharofermentans DSM 14828 TaxID=1120975 RepID=A0A1M4XFZ8_9FIRM|nr:rRNA maturation RNase YbeY [Alkalibacter saccharofermentans]SHE92399.1 probable rRNA maturation factor [Alkalibacter saccharofermentans DSM 14828]
MEIYIDNRSKGDLSGEMIGMIEETVNKAIEVEGFKLDFEVSISIVDEEEIKNLNNTYRNKDSITDVLSFPMYEDDDLEPVLLGDIIICMQRAAEQAGSYGHGLEREMCYLTAHGMLHLLGYDHMGSEEKTEMRSKEKKIMEKLNLQR